LKIYVCEIEVTRERERGRERECDIYKEEIFKNFDAKFLKNA